MLQFRPLYMLWLKLQNTHRRAPCKKVILWDILAKQGGVRARGEKEEKKKVHLRLCAVICLTHFKSG